MGLLNAAAKYPFSPGAHTLACNLHPLSTEASAPCYRGSAHFSVHLFLPAKAGVLSSLEAHPVGCTLPGVYTSVCFTDESRRSQSLPAKAALPVFVDESQGSQQVSASIEAEQDESQQLADFGLNGGNPGRQRSGSIC